MPVIAAILIVLLSSVPAWAGPADSDIPLPIARPMMSPDAEATPPLPMTRPAEGAPVSPKDAVPAGEETEAETEPAAPMEPRIYQAACPAMLSGQVTAKALPPIEDGICRVQSPLLVSAVTMGGRTIALSASTIMNCRMAGQLAAWVARFDAYADVLFKARIDTLLVGTGYECRPRNNQAGSDYSEHGFANALDITGFVLKDGTRLALPEDWGAGAEADAMRYAHDAACGLFTTVLGPEANTLHADHLHLDLGCHGQSCTYRLCE